MTIDRTKEICNSVLDAIGETPMIRLNNLLKSLEKDESYPKVEADICCKCEYFNAGGSVKDRIGKQMVEDAEKEGLIASSFSQIASKDKATRVDEDARRERDEIRRQLRRENERTRRM